ncbi:astacin [Cooperia oncophora]
MRTFILALLVAVCVNASIFSDLKKSIAVGGIKGLIKEKVTSKIKNTINRIKQVLKENMAEFRSKLAAYKEKILKKLTLPPELRKKLTEKLKVSRCSKGKPSIKSSPTGDSIEEINIRSKIAGALFQGDMVLSKEQQQRVTDDITGTRTKRQAYNDLQYPGRRWHQGVYYFLSGAVFHSLIKQLAAVFPHSAYFYNPDSIRVFAADGCWSYIGRLGGVQDLSLGYGCESIGTAAHELGHALGFFHTHARYDRDRYIYVDVENIMPDWVSQFTLETMATNNNYDLPYDYGSLMHYGATSATGTGMPTMLPREDELYTETLGISFHLVLRSTYDQQALQLHRCNLDACEVYNTTCKNDGFPNPRNCSRCICPGGYGGQFCDEEPSEWSSCGQVLNATDQWTLLVDELGDWWAYGLREDFVKCHYWIKAPAGRKVQVKFVDFTYGFGVDGCPYAGVEIKTQTDQRLTGYRYEVMATED